MIMIMFLNPIFNFILSNLDIGHAQLVISLLQQTIYLRVILNQNKYFIIIQKTTTISIKLSE